MAGMFGDLPDAGQVHPGMQARVERALPEMDEAVSEMVEFLSSVSDEDADALQRFLKEKKNPGMEIAQWFDEVESTLGVSPKRRRQTRAFITHAVSRLKNQPPRLLFDEYVGKVERVSARTGTLEEVEREMIAQMGEQAFWERQQRLAMYAAAWAEAGVVAEDVPGDELPPVDIQESGEADGEVDSGIDAEISADGGPAGESADAGAMLEPEDAAKPTPVWDFDLSDKTCAQLNHAVKAVFRRYRDGLYAEEEYRVRYIALNAERVRKKCEVAVEPAASPVDLQTADCDEVSEWAEQELEDLREAQHRGYVSREEAAQRVKAIRNRPELRRCQKQKARWVGIVCLGIGGLFAAISIALFAANSGSRLGWIPGAITATPAAVLLIIGLFWLVMAAARYRDV
jgi:hypothetical protein